MAAPTGHLRVPLANNVREWVGGGVGLWNSREHACDPTKRLVGGVPPRTLSAKTGPGPAALLARVPPLARGRTVESEMLAPKCQPALVEVVNRKKYNFERWITRLVHR